MTPPLPIPELKPGWTSRLFGIETGLLVACDARWDGGDWRRGDAFTFLYRSRRGKFFVLRDLHQWSIATPDEARRLYDALPEKVVEAERVFGVEPELEPLPVARGDDPDEIYAVLVNDAWEFSIWPDRLPLPAGWRAIGISGRQPHVFDFIRRECVFGAPNPGFGSGDAP